MSTISPLTGLAGTRSSTWDYVQGAARRTESPVTMAQLQAGLQQLRSYEPSRSPVTMDLHTGEVRSGVARQGREESTLPLRLGPLLRAFERIEKGDGWLLDRNPVIYTREGRVHIDFVNLAGFVVQPDGQVVSRSVNPW